MDYATYFAGHVSLMEFLLQQPIYEWNPEHRTILFQYIESSYLVLTTPPKPPVTIVISDDEKPPPPQSIDKKRKGPEQRTRADPKQVETYMRIYRENPWPCRDTLDALALETKRPRYKVKIWFQNKRAKDKKDHKLPTRTVG